MKLSELLRVQAFGQSCQRALEQSWVDRTRDADEAWRINGSGKLRGQAAAVLRELWKWRDAEAEAADRPPFHILQNQALIDAAERFAAGEKPDYRHFSARRRQGFVEAAARALQSSEEDWPVFHRRLGTRPTPEMVRRTEALRQRRDEITSKLGLEPSFLAARGALEAIASEPAAALELLAPWQRQLLELEA